MQESEKRKQNRGDDLTDGRFYFRGGGTSLNKIYNIDCMEGMKQIPDAVVNKFWTRKLVF